MPKSYLAVHIRRGDKLLEEATLTEVDRYISLIKCSKLDNNTVFISTDDYSVIEEFKIKKPHWNIISFTNSNQQGHLQSDFNNKTKEDIYIDTLELISELIIHRNAKYYIGTITSNITKMLALLRDNKETTFSMDKMQSNVYDNLINYEE